MKTITFRDIEQLSAYLDGQLSWAETTRLETRLASDRELASALSDLRQTRTVLRKTPQRRAPRNFTLTPKLAGIRPPVPRAVPALSWASAVAAVLFVCTLGVNLLGQLSFGAAAPMAVESAPYGGGGYGGGAAEPTQAPASTDNTYPPTATPEAFKYAPPEATPTITGIGGAEGYNTPTPENYSVLQQPPAPSAPARKISPWLIVWPALAVLLLVAALLVRWTNRWAFERKISKTVDRGR
jgi:hypothetical protein